MPSLMSCLLVGFSEGRSTVTALLNCTNEWLKGLEDGKDMQFSSILSRTSKLVALGLDDHITCWLNNYLANRSQPVVFNGSISDPVPELSEVPQGSLTSSHLH